MWCLANVVFKMWVGGGCVVLRKMGKQVIAFFFFVCVCVCDFFLGKKRNFLGFAST